MSKSELLMYIMSKPDLAIPFMSTQYLKTFNYPIIDARHQDGSQELPQGKIYYFDTPLYK